MISGDVLWLVADLLRWSHTIAHFAATCRAMYNACHRRTSPDGPHGPFIGELSGAARTWRYGVLPIGLAVHGWASDRPRTVAQVQRLARAIRKSAAPGVLELRAPGALCLIPMVQMAGRLGCVTSLTLRARQVIVGESVALAVGVRSMRSLTCFTATCLPLAADLESWTVTLDALNALEYLDLTGSGGALQCAPVTTRTLIKSNASYTGKLDVEQLCQDLQRMPRLRRLELSSAGIGETELLGPALSELCELRTLSFRGNQLGQKLAFTCLRLPVSLVALDISFQLNSSHMERGCALIGGVGRLSYLERIDIGHMMLGAHVQDARRVSRMARELRFLRTLLLRGNWLGSNPTDAERLVEDMPASLRELDLGDNALRATDLHALGRLPLTYLNVRGNRCLLTERPQCLAHVGDLKYGEV